MARQASPALFRVATASVALALALPAVLAGWFLTTTPPSPGSSSPQSPPSLAALPVAAPVAPKSAAPAAAATPQPARVTAIIARPDRFDYGAWLWDDRASTTGPLVVTVDLRAQLLRVWRGGREVGVSTILYGAPDSPTPLGTFPITQKSAKHVSNIYNTPMPFAMRLTNDGVMVHGSNVRAGWASNGCVGVPVEFARRLFAEAKLGDRVVITDGKPLHGMGDSLPAV